MRAFRRRTYSGPADFLRDVLFLIGSRSLMKAAMRSGAISFGFRERLMMVVPDPEAARSLVETYSDDRAAMINVVLRMIRAGNLMGNTLDWLLYRSFGRLGLTAREAP